MSRASPASARRPRRQLIQQYGDVEAVLASVEEITKPKLKQNLIEHAGNARLSRELVRLVCDAPLPEPLEDLALKGIPPEPLQAFLEDQGFKSLLNRMIGGGSPSTGATVRNDVMAAMDRKPTTPSKSLEPEGPRRSRSIVRNMRRSPTKRRSTAGSPRRAPRAMSRSTPRPTASTASSPGSPASAWRPRPNRACYIPVGHVGGDLYSETPNQLPLQLVLDRLKPLLEDPAVLKIGHNLKYDWVMFDKAGIDVAPYDDTMLMSFDLDAGRSFGHGLDDLAKSHFDHECISFKSLCGTGAKQITFDKVPLKEATEYAAEDADIALAPVAAAEAAHDRRACGRGSTSGSTGRWSRSSAGWSGAGSRSTATISPS